MAENAPLICKDIHKTFNENEVLKGISLETRKGDVVSLIGSSGSGKSTFLRCINLLETPTAGEVIVHGEPIRFKQNRKARAYPPSIQRNALSPFDSNQRPVCWNLRANRPALSRSSGMRYAVMTGVNVRLTT